MMRLLTALLMALSAWTAHAATGDWTYYLAYHNATQAIPAGEAVYALYDGNLLSYDNTTQEVRLFSKNDGLNGRNITHMAYVASARCFVLVYADLGIDLLYTDGGVTNLAQIKNADDGTTTVNDISANGTDVVLALSDGVAHIDVARREIHGYYRLSRSITSAAVYAGRIYAATTSGILSCDMDDNLSDPTLWQTGVADAARLLLPFADGLYYVVSSGSNAGLWRLTANAGSNSNISTLHLGRQVFTSASANSRRALFMSPGSAVTYPADSPTDPELVLTLPTACNALAEAADGTFWSAEGTDGLKAYTLSNGSLADTGVRIGNYGPRRDLCYYLTYAADRLLIAGGRLDPAGLQHYAGTIMTYENDNWAAFQEDGISEQTGVLYRDITRVIQDPDDPTHHYASAGGTGLYEFRDGQFVRHYSNHNSPLSSAAANDPYYVRVDGLNYDGDGNLWMVNNGVDTALHVLKADGSWSGIYVDALRNSPTMEKTLFDQRGRLWVASRRSASDIRYTAGLLCLDYNGTIDDDSDDVITFRSTAYNQDGTSCDLSLGIYDIVEDTDGALWVGTGGGLYVVSDPDAWSSSDFRITQIKVPRNDGTNYADYLLAGVAVNAIAIDGAGRKWIGTLGNGLYLVSADGTSIIHHFEAASSPLLSDNIYDIVVNPSTGEVIIGTDAGLCAYQSDATAAADRLDKNNIKVYPNPVRPEYHGNITVTGLTADADIKVTTTGGQVVAAGTSNGGTFIWDGRTTAGRRVSTGVYYIMAATADGSQGVVAKVVVI